MRPARICAATVALLVLYDVCRTHPLIGAVMACSLIATLFVWSACILAGRADDADEALIHDFQFGDAPTSLSGASPAAASVSGSGTHPNHDHGGEIVAPVDN